MTRRYRSLTSEVAWRPPSTATMGRRPGGMTGMRVRNIHYGRTLARIMPRSTERRLPSFSRSAAPAAGENPPLCLSRSFRFGLLEKWAEMDRLDIFFGFEVELLHFLFRLIILEFFDFALVLGFEFRADAVLFFLVYGVDYVAGKVDDLFKFAAADTEHHGEARRNRAQEPHVRHGDREVDVAHALAAHDGAGNLDAALLADDALIADAAVFAAIALVVALGAENLFVKQRVLFGPLG